MPYRRALCRYSWLACSSSYAQAITCHIELENYPKRSRHFDRYRSVRKRPNSLSLCDIVQRVLRRPVGCYPHRFRLCSESPLAVFRFALSDAPSTSPLRCEIAMGMPAAASGLATCLVCRSTDRAPTVERHCPEGASTLRRDRHAVPKMELGESQRADWGRAWLPGQLQVGRQVRRDLVGRDAVGLRARSAGIGVHRARGHKHAPDPAGLQVLNRALKGPPRRLS